MIDSIKKGRQRYGLRQYLRRRWRYYSDKLFRPVDFQKLLRSFKEIGIHEGDLLCVHCKFSALGYVKGGPKAFIEALLASVGPNGTIMMPTFSMSGSMLSYVESGEVFDVRQTKSKVGMLTETFRNIPGAIRSLHPTNSVAAKGRLAQSLVENHENSYTPYGMHTPYGRLASMNGKILMVNTHVQSFLHHIQEVVEFPNLYLEKPKSILGVDYNGRKFKLETLIMRPIIPYFIILDGTEGHKYDYVILHDYALIFPKNRKIVIRQAGYRLHKHENIWKRQEKVIEKGIFREKRLGRANIGLMDASAFLSYLEPEFKNVIEKYRNKYDPKKIESLHLPYV